jgi:hypothetical protein
MNSLPAQPTRTPPAMAEAAARGASIVVVQNTDGSFEVVNVVPDYLDLELGLRTPVWLCDKSTGEHLCCGRES